MTHSKFKVGDKVTIISNDLQAESVGQIGTIKKVYPSFNENTGYGYVYRVEVNGKPLKGVAGDNDLKKA